MAAPAVAVPNPAASQTPMGSQRTMNSSPRPASQGSNTTDFVEANARETNGEAALSDAKPPAAPAANDDDEAPSLRLLASAGHALAGTHWFLWLLLVLLIAVIAYKLSRKTKRRPARRNFAGRRFYSDEDE
jgi:hypothetical protein